MSLKTLFLLIIAFLMPVLASAAAVSTPYSTSTIVYPASQPGTAGTRYPVPTLNSSDSTTWGWRCTVTGGIGLTFGGNSPFSKDGCLHTRILQGGQWVQIDSSLRAANPLQPYHTRAYTLRTRLKDALSYGRHIFFQGRTASQESAFLADSVNPELTAVSSGLTQLVTDMQAVTGLASYYSGQIAWAAPRFTAAAGSIVSLGTSVDSTELANLRNIQIALEIATEALDAEPGSRVLSMIAYDSTNQLFVIFGGDHLDFQRNDLWVFNPAIPRWEQRHAVNGPCPRADHFLTTADSGRIKLTGGYGGATYTYNHIGPDIWYYDVANNTWIKPASATAYPTDMRTYRGGNLAPEFQMSGTKPNAAANETFLAGIPSNTWVNMNPPVRGPGHRDWGSLAYDAANDMIYTYSGGHVAYNGTDVL
ncbi:MAG: hypothetical protein JNL74_20850, partial [Fibrobacteres bacterium]|nr:hypothetical protein [Fibrobacterota bacterium]